jgi:anti-sigma regulatory factor (Ser/Thr protein kinase)
MPTSESAAIARRFVRGWLAERDLDELSENAALVTSELVSNAVVHVGAPCTLSLEDRGGRRIRVTVEDPSDVTPVRGSPSESALGGRGLPIVDQLSMAWGTELGKNGGKTIWCDLA